MADGLKLNDTQIAKAKFKLEVARLARQDLETYLLGCADGLGIDGGHKLNMQTWVFTPVKKDEPPQEKKEAGQ